MKEAKNASSLTGNPFFYFILFKSKIKPSKLITVNVSANNFIFDHTPLQDKRA